MRTVLIAAAVSLALALASASVSVCQALSGPPASGASTTAYYRVKARGGIDHYYLGVGTEPFIVMLTVEDDVCCLSVGSFRMCGRASSGGRSCVVSYVFENGESLEFDAEPGRGWLNVTASGNNGRVLVNFSGPQLTR